MSADYSGLPCSGRRESILWGTQDLDGLHCTAVPVSPPTVKGAEGNIPVILYGCAPARFFLYNPCNQNSQQNIILVTFNPVCFQNISAIPFP